MLDFNFMNQNKPESQINGSATFTRSKQIFLSVKLLIFKLARAYFNVPVTDISCGKNKLALTFFWLR